MKLVIYLTTNERVHLAEREGPLEIGPDKFPSWDPAEIEKYGRNWAQLWPTDIVMLVEEDV